jgi:hypothetical protein
VAVGGGCVIAMVLVSAVVGSGAFPREGPRVFGAFGGSGDRGPEPKVCLVVGVAGGGCFSRLRLGAF